MTKTMLLRSTGVLCMMSILLLSHAASASVVTIIDNGDAGYSAVGDWILWSSSGFQNDFDYKGVGTGEATASWTLSGQTPGNYRVSVTWEAFSNRPVDATYTVLDGATILDAVAIDQTQAPGDFSEGGALWQDLGEFALTGDTLTVRLSDLATPSGRFVIADAVRFERLSAVPIPAALWLFASALGLLGWKKRTAT